MATASVTSQARAIVLACFNRELLRILRRRGIPSNLVDRPMLEFYARTQFDANRSPRPVKRLSEEADDDGRR